MAITDSIALARWKMEDILDHLVCLRYEPTEYTLEYRVGGWKEVTLACRITHRDIFISPNPILLDYTIYASPMRPEWSLWTGAVRWQHRTERTLLTHLEELRRTPND